MKVEVDFLIPGQGKTTETYDLNVPEDMEAWKDTSSLCNCIQLRVRTIKETSE